MKEGIVIYSSVPSKLMYKALWKGSLMALVGIILLIYAGVFFNLMILTAWGFSIFLASMGLITCGLLPYRRLMRLSSKPDKIVLTNQLSYYVKNRKILELPYSAVEKMVYIDKENLYGIGISIKPDCKDQLAQISSSHERQAIQDKARKQFELDLFFPYFSRRSFEEMQQWIEM